MDLFYSGRGRRLSLRFLSAYLLGAAIQGGSHDSVEDALAALEDLAAAVSARAATAAEPVLLDAPCSATGTIRRHPDILRLRRPDEAAHAAIVQAEL